MFYNRIDLKDRAPTESRIKIAVFVEHGDSNAKILANTQKEALCSKSADSRGEELFSRAKLLSSLAVYSIFAVVILMIILAFLQVEFICFLRAVLQSRNFLWSAVVTVVNETIS